MNVILFMIYFFTQLVVWAATKLPTKVVNVSFARPIVEHPRKVLQTVTVKKDMPDCRMTHHT